MLVPSPFKMPDKVVEPVPPLFTEIVVPPQTPVAIVPRVVIFVEPTQVDKAVFSTLFKAIEVLRLAVDVAERVEPFVEYNTPPESQEV